MVMFSAPVFSPPPIPAPPSPPTATSWPEPDSGADGQIAAVALFHTGVCVSALQGVAQFNVQADVAGALGSHRRVACTLRPCAAGGVDVGVLQGHVGRRPRVRPDGDIVGGGSGRIPVPDDGGGILLWSRRPWLTFWPLSVAETVMLPSSKYQVSAIATVGRKTAISARETSRVKKLSDVHSVASLTVGRFRGVQTNHNMDWKKMQGDKRIYFGASAGFPVAKIPICDKINITYKLEGNHGRRDFEKSDRLQYCRVPQAGGTDPGGTGGKTELFRQGRLQMGAGENPCRM